MARRLLGWSSGGGVESIVAAVCCSGHLFEPFGTAVVGIAVGWGVADAEAGPEASESRMDRSRL